MGGYMTGNFKMTEEFASAMVTVIPIILLLGWAEVQKLSTTYVAKKAPSLDREIRAAMYRILSQEAGSQADADTSSGQEAENRKPPGQAKIFEGLFAVVWGVLAVLHVLAELYLVRWLATTERAPSPGMARNVTLIAGAGFVMLLVGAFVPPLMLLYTSTALRLVSSIPLLSRFLKPFIGPTAREQLMREASRGEGDAATAEPANSPRDTSADPVPSRGSS
ncbi:hypothetical protein ACWD4L_25820 [Streptomyces sp. NPDC002596]